MLTKMIDDKMAQRLGYLVAENKELFDLLSEILQLREDAAKATYTVPDNYPDYVEKINKEHQRLYNRGKKQ